MIDLTGRRVLVTGASRGIGFGVAQAFARARADLVVLADDAGITEAAAALGAQAIRCDVTDAEAVAAMAGAVGRLDVLVNNAGMELPTPLGDPDPEVMAVFERVLEVNVSGMYRVTRALAPVLIDGGAIINTASVWSKHAPALFSAYAASKHAVLGLTRVWARELGPRGIRVNCVCPGWVATGPALNSLAAVAADQGRPEVEVRAEIEAGQDLPGLMEPADVAGAYLFLASDLAASITGQSLVVDRGEHQG